MEALRKIQHELKAPKGQYNSFGKYKYRSCEDILEAVKPLLDKYDAALTLNDEVVEVGGRIYIKATANFTSNTNAIVCVSAYAREPESKKGMDESQITGTASSYARKYALNGLFLIDDTKDADTDAYHEQTAKAEGIDDTKVKTVEKVAADKGVEIEKLCKKYKVADLSKLTIAQFTACIKGLEGMPDKQ